MPPTEPEENSQATRQLSEPDHAFRRQVVTIVVSAAIGFVPTATISVFQIANQRTQFVTEKRVAALQAYAISINKGTTVISALEREGASLDEVLFLTDGNPTEERLVAEMRNLAKIQLEVSSAQNAWLADVQGAAAMVEAIFGKDASSIAGVSASDFGLTLERVPFEPNKQNLTLETFRERIKGLRQNVDAIIEKTSKTMMYLRRHLSILASST